LQRIISQKKLRMKKFVFYSIILLGLFTGCETKNEPSVEPHIVIKGSDTEFELVSEFARIFAEREGVIIDVEGKGSSSGIEKLIEGKIDIANSSREMTESEIRDARQNSVEPVQAIIATDAIAFITHPQLGIDSLSVVQLKQILSGHIINWKELGGPDLPIKIYGRNTKSGTYKFIQNRFVRETGFVKTMIQLESNKAIINAVKKDPAGIGYVGTGFIMEKDGRPTADIWALYLYTEGDKAYSPYETRAVNNGDYPVIRPLYQYFNGQPAGVVKSFLEFELSEEGQKIAREFGYFPISSFYESLNKENGIVF
jgi:phosphate transport system substrate-binding protein